MKIVGFLVFLSIILGIHFVTNFYIYTRGVQALESLPQYRNYFRVFILFMSFTYIIGRVLERFWISPVSDIFHWAGAFWFAFMLYLFILLMSIDLVRLGNVFFNFLPDVGSIAYNALKIKSFIGVGLVSIIVVLAGFINAWNPKITELNISINKSGGELSQLRIVAATDIHLGTIIAKRKSTKLVKKINQLNPDIILFAGDILDEDVKPVIRQDLGSYLKELSAPLGIFASTGNHEYIGGFERSVAYLRDHGITMLEDSVILLNSSIYIAGRKDRDSQRFNGLGRVEVKDLLAHVDKSKPILLLDHQPYNLNAAMNEGVDFQLSGHTHHGQLWPFGYITDAIFELSHGYLLKGNTHFYVSTGYGTWGPPVRLGNRPEILVFNLVFTGQK